MVGKVKLCLIAGLFGLSSCVDFFEFNTSLEDRAIVIDGVFTDVSAQDYFEEFNEMRFFDVELKWASKVSNVRDELISGAEIELSSDLNEFWDYTEVSPGLYQLFYPDLKALSDRRYKLIVRLPNGDVIESSLEQAPGNYQTGEISFVEKNEPQYVFEAGESVIKGIEGIEVSMDIPKGTNSETSYYRWDFITTWILKAARIPESSPFGLCWVTEQYYLDEFRITEVKDQHSFKSLFFLPTEGNLQVENGFSTRIRQLAMSSDYHQFWKDLENQVKQSELFAPPPYNLATNLTTSADDLDVYGYFGVANEYNYTWYLNLKDLTYTPTFSAPCFLPFANDRPAYCGNCLNYESLKFRDEITNEQPAWWRP